MIYNEPICAVFTIRPETCNKKVNRVIFLIHVHFKGCSNTNTLQLDVSSCSHLPAWLVHVLLYARTGSHVVTWINWKRCELNHREPVRCSTGGTDPHSQLPLWKVGATGRSGHPLCFVWGLERFDLLSNPHWMVSLTEALKYAWPKTHPVKRPVMLHIHGPSPGSANHISSHDQCWGEMGLVLLVVSTHCLLWGMKRNLNMHCLILNSFVLLW